MVLLCDTEQTLVVQQPSDLIYQATSTPLKTPKETQTDTYRHWAGIFQKVIKLSYVILHRYFYT